jgi:hypothetical protein
LHDLPARGIGKDTLLLTRHLFFLALVCGRDIQNCNHPLRSASSVFRQVLTWEQNAGFARSSGAREENTNDTNTANNTKQKQSCFIGVIRDIRAIRVQSFRPQITT